MVAHNGNANNTNLALQQRSGLAAAVTVRANQSVTVECPPGSPAGSITQSVSCFVPNFDINDAAGNTVYRLDGDLTIWKIKFCKDN